MAINVRDIAYARFSAPELDAMQDFLTDFGLTVAGRSPQRLWMRGCGAAPFIHVTELGEPAYRGFGFEAEDQDGLHILAERDGVPIQTMTDEPGGGSFVRLRDPDGFEIDVVARAPAADNPPFPALQAWNTSESLARGTVARRVAPSPSTVVRLGHMVHAVADINRTWDWYAERFRLTISDEVVAEDQARVALFIRLDRGNEPSDHHALNFGQFPDGRSAFHHAAFEVADFDDLMVGGEFLASRNYRHRWGVGRHILGSQVFDYWSDPWGHIVEHWTDGDKFDAAEPTHKADIATMVGIQWGPGAPADMVG
ncbi:2,3-dihydroxybiphenyl 1,2-dioxygenase [Sphingobium jiangsuense]|uniref:Catechol 2,3-dioxygenase-like lactoylglutathione lyase family enzyme n=1 Tax=Sphingobium jiangsuense TaxID=870476 RepID=A0A7W6FPS4_9SPHN|nr:VOC family protein [Sphingobium jiangsuense]MBB3926381.1 catechol 2,3-dioxygenase-like lactoylglutathione lyase family enzyme [Sphingobium jiangsuense]GLS99077.1 2,3-dihydroxybiphenyl 1,2-dioxygenase [Sphingobium jiangsuense]